jgi:hypothetical protein
VLLDVLAIWSDRADDVRGRPLDRGTTSPRTLWSRSPPTCAAFSLSDVRQGINFD